MALGGNGNLETASFSQVLHPEPPRINEEGTSATG